MSENKKVKTKEVELTERQKYLQSQLNDLQNKENSLMFQLDQVKASQQVFSQAFIEESKEVSDEVLEEKETTGS